MGRNYFTGNCICCGVWVPVGAGYYQGRRVRCLSCKGKGNKPLTDRAKAQQATHHARLAVEGFTDVTAVINKLR